MAMMVDYDMFEIRLTLSWSYARSGNLDSAINFAEEAMEMAKAMNTHSCLKAAGYLTECYVSAGYLEKALSYFEEISTIALELLENNPDDTFARISLKVCYAGGGRIYLKWGDMEKATLLLQAVYSATASDLNVEAPDQVTLFEWKRMHASSCEYLSELHIKQQKGEEVMIFAKEFNELMVGLVEACPEDPDFQLKYAVSMNYMGEAYRLNGKMQEAIGYYTKAYETTRQLTIAYNNYYEFVTGLVVALEKLGNWFTTAGDYEHAVKAYMEQYAIVKKLYDDDPEDLMKTVNLMSAAHHIANLHFRAEELAESEPYMKEANELAILLVEKYPDVVDYKHFLGIISSGLYLLYRFCGQRDASLYFCRKAYNTFQELATIMPDNEEYKKALEYYPVMLDYLQSNDYEK